MSSPYNLMRPVAYSFLSNAEFLKVAQSTVKMLLLWLPSTILTTGAVTPQSPHISKKKEHSQAIWFSKVWARDGAMCIFEGGVAWPSAFDPLVPREMSWGIVWKWPFQTSPVELPSFDGLNINWTWKKRVVEWFSISRFQGNQAMLIITSLITFFKTVNSVRTWGRVKPKSSFCWVRGIAMNKITLGDGDSGLKNKMNISQKVIFCNAALKINVT